ncbi:hypothetical protein RFI_01054 [Reticulomyxa filosa]|uniref:N-acetylgalactosaminide beta-1,3-galactosyltransferase n=1 Tax=Reticulomyxa filosa TaxID=46433 RepID=X6PD24_RETFI|nr:hypothetical protein RFI_01054 [Reticulomyxa filosa]|eukprot:ETO36008.1 hypothetical protein RFI_01054 [Reticulomyxa filosa]
MFLEDSWHPFFVKIINLIYLIPTNNQVIICHFTQIQIVLTSTCVLFSRYKKMKSRSSSLAIFWHRNFVLSIYIGLLLLVIVITFLVGRHNLGNNSFHDGLFFISGGSRLQSEFDEDDFVQYDSKSLNSEHVNQNPKTAMALAQTREVIVDKEWGEIYTPHRVWCLVPTLWPKKMDSMKWIAQTWGKFCDQLIFVIDEEFGVNAPYVYYGATILKIKCEYRQSTPDRNIWEKVWKMWHHIGKHHLYDSEWFLKIDDDTFFSAVNFKGFARYFNPDKEWYFGHTLLHLWQSKNIAFNSGTCYAISRETLKRVHTIFATKEFQDDPQRRGFFFLFICLFLFFFWCSF